MTIWKHEMRRGMKALLAWSLVIGGMLAFCLMLFPELKQQVASIQMMIDGLSKGFGGIVAAFGMDRLNYGEVMGFYGVYGGFMLGIGGMIYAGMIGCTMLAKEEKEHTAETLLSYPISRAGVCFFKWLSMVCQLLLMNVIVMLIAGVSFVMIGEKPALNTFWLYHLAQFFMQFEIACICFGISAFLRKEGSGIGMGIAAIFYFLGVAGNIAEKAGVLRYITPYAYADAAEIIASASLKWTLVGLGMAYAAAGMAAAFWRYAQKDIY
ncbi:MAG: ABC transporter permease subunit [Eubacteriales bacterium]|nr:ABC transporter permease subunit [Eubacteriales bacterium]